MGRMLGIGGYATGSGVTMVNTGLGRVVRASRDSNGDISVKELTILCKLMKFYRSEFGSKLLKVPILSEFFKILVTLGVPFFSLIMEIANIFHERKIKVIKKLITNTRKYHGAEHKVINMFEASDNILEETVETASSYSRIHARCGTNIVTFLIPLVLCFYFIEEMFFATMLIDDLLMIIGSIVLLILGMKMLQLFQKPILRKFLKPGLLMQKYITTKEPENEQIEVALTALKAALKV